jgi:hypothetical protein
MLTGTTILREGDDMNVYDVSAAPVPSQAAV